jgi:hypothetical protein
VSSPSTADAPQQQQNGQAKPEAGSFDW